jgi:hypothetical protein
MTPPDTRFAQVLADIDAANARDPRTVEIDGRQEPAELIYGRRMTETLARMAPDASECLQIAARGQHIERWTIKRTAYPAGRAGYLQWRRDQRAYQANRLGEIMAAAGYDADAVARVGVLIRKERMKTDAEVQLFEDVICVMFFEHYLPGFMSRVEKDTLADILSKTWTRMSDFGHQHVLKLNLPPAVPQLLQRGLARQSSG